MPSRRVPTSGIAITLALIALAGCNHDCITGTLTLHVAWPEPATTNEAIAIRGTVRGGGDWQQFVPIAGGSSLGVSIDHGDVVIMSTVTDPIRDACGSLVVDSWDVDQGRPESD